MIIVLEGCDGAGKTHLAHQLLEVAHDVGVHNTELWHRGVPQRHPLEEYVLDLETDYPPAKRADSLVVCDRWHLGQTVYGGLYRDEDLLGRGGTWYVDAVLRSRGALQLILDQPEELLRTRMTERGEDYLKTEHVDHVRYAYLRLAETFPRSVEVASGVFTPTDALDLLDRARIASERAASLAPFTTYVGPPKPDVLLLGERKGDGPNADPRYDAAFVPHGASSGNWLCEVLADAGHGGSTFDVGLANALEEDVPELVETLGYPRVVALGKRAHDELVRVGVEHGTVPHPRFMRRFHYGDGRQYAMAVTTAATTNEEVNPWAT